MRSQKLNAKKSFWVGPDSIHGQARETGKGGKGFERVLVRYFRPQFLAGAEENAAACYIDDLAAETYQVHFDATEVRVIDRLIMETVKMKVGMALTVETGKIIHGELR